MTVITKPESGAPISESYDADLLETIADWQVDLVARIRRAQLVFELVDSETDFQPLIEEARQFARVCACLSWRAKE